MVFIRQILKTLKNKIILVCAAIKSDDILQNFWFVNGLYDSTILYSSEHAEERL